MLSSPIKNPTAFNPIDTFVPLEKQFEMLKTIDNLYEKGKEALKLKITISVIKNDGLYGKVINMKYDIENENLNNEKIQIKNAEKPITKVIIGDSVRVNSLNAEGIILELPDQNGNVLVQVGMLKMKVPKNSLISIEDKKDLSNKTKNIIKRKSSTIKTEMLLLDVRTTIFHE